jgi:3-phenylpropionate/trans-cinnamate dioxygenase ferredoxin subunit
MSTERDGSPPDEPDEVGRWVAVCTQARLAAEGIVRARIGNAAILIVQDGDDLFACERACPHEQADLALGCVRDGHLHCPRHQASFNLHDGRISQGWHSRRLRRYQVRRYGAHVWLDSRDISAG